MLIRGLLLSVFDRKLSVWEELFYTDKFLTFVILLYWCKYISLFSKYTRAYHKPVPFGTHKIPTSIFYLRFRNQRHYHNNLVTNPSPGVCLNVSLYQKQQRQVEIHRNLPLNSIYFQRYYASCTCSTFTQLFDTIHSDIIIYYIVVLFTILLATWKLCIIWCYRLLLYNCRVMWNFKQTFRWLT